MSYVFKTLQPGENILYEAKITWLIYLPSIIMMILSSPMTIGGIALLFTPNNFSVNEQQIRMVLFMPFIVGSLFWLKAWITRHTTEFVITTKRIITKQGFISRTTTEINHKKVESFRVRQGIIGRMLNYGTIIIVGTGGGAACIDDIDDPLDFRKNAISVIDTI